jgi:copper transport protein
LQGTYVLSWRAASSDGHPIAGSVVFSVGAPSDGSPDEQPSVDLTVRGILWLARATMLITLLLGAGSSGFRMVAQALPATARRATFATIAVGAVAAVLSVPLHGLDALGRPLGDLAAPEVWALTMTSGYGASVIAALLAMALAAIAIAAQRPSLAGWISVLSLIAIGLTATLSGHASSADPRWLTRSMVFIHVIGIAWWAGELLPLALSLRQSDAMADPPLLRFSRFIPFVIAPLVVSGIALAVIQLGPPSAAWLSPYTYLFALKVGMLLVLFALAALNRWSLTAKVVAREEAATRHMRGAIVLEIILIMVIVGVAAGWRFTPPPRSLATELVHAKSVSLEFPNGEITGRLTVAPGQSGPNTVTVVLLHNDQIPAEVKSVRAFLSSPELGIDRLEIGGTMVELGEWRSEEAIIPVAGNWIVAVEVRISDFVQTRASATVSIGASTL